MSRNMVSFNNQETYPTWNENDKVGEVIKGLVTEKKTVNTEKGAFPLLVIEVGGGECKSVWCSRKLLADFFEFVRVGTYVEIEYLGKQKPKKGGREFHGYRVDYDKDTLSQDIEQIAKEVMGEDIPDSIDN